MGYKVALVGGGGIAVSHLEALRRMEELDAVAVADISKERAESVAGRFGIAAYTDYRDMIEREKPDIAVVTLPHFLHKEASIHAAEAGCHLLLEKPMALDARECDAIIAAVRRAGVRLMVGHTQHYIAHNRAAKRIVEEGRYGKLVMINDVRHVNYYADTRPGWFFEKAKAGGGIFMNLGSHSVDKLQWLTGSRVEQVKAAVSHYGAKGDIEGSGLAWLRLANGVPATISQSGYPGGVSRNETELVFTGGMVKLMTGQGLWASEGGAYVEIPVEQEELPFVLQFRDLVRYIEEGVEPSSSMDYSRSVVAVVEAMYRSHETGTEQNVAGEAVR
ncbi:Gfo/Idh/MocA family protein [Paenibacillus flagellatus]|uniref:Gfo/Idh/MocA family oxidoreductase n=1 Tax=Paenibacillus flagellatus TaxID=2211139 RepID=A0A2V5KFI0_9BACL|nr:Gfo/Idh/MocA family oxidoreductase [Paenibacillus flagellatus]PYI57224.1 gfo/Idh/MocA family oxidoreductase [Paenibacillus flagellatus]